MVELIVAIGIFAILASGVTYVVINSYSSFYGTGDRQAIYEYAQEGIEAVKTMQANSWQQIEDAVGINKGLARDASGLWQFSGTSDTRGALTRVVLISDVQRDSEGDIVDAGGTNDVNTKKVTVTISGTGIADYVSTTYITNWDGKSWRQTNWSGGLAEFWLNNTYASSSVNISTSTAGQISLDFGQDPKIDYGQGKLTLDFGTSTGYTNTKINQRKFEGGWYLVLVPQNYQADKYDTFEDTDFSNWAYYANLSRSSAYSHYDDYVGFLDNISSGQENILTGAFGTTPGERIIIMSFKDAGGNEVFWGGHNNNKTPMDMYGLYTFGYNEGSLVDSAGYLYRVGAGSEQQVGVARDNNWHYLVMIDAVNTAEETYYNRYLYLDGATRYSYTCVSPPSSCSSAQFKTFAALRYDGSANDLYIDDIILSKATSVFESGNTVIDIQPLGAISFDAFAKTDTTNSGRWQGTNTYEFQFSTNGGTNFGVAGPDYNEDGWLTLSSANLAANIDADGDGLDVLRVRVTQAPSSSYRDDTHIPRTDQIVVDFTPTEDYIYSGWMYSSIFEIGSADKELESISVEQNVPASCDLSIELEASNDRSFATYVSHTFSDDGATYYTSSTPASLNGYRYLRYKAGMVACGSSSPTLYDVRVRYK